VNADHWLAHRLVVIKNALQTGQKLLVKATKNAFRINFCLSF